MRSVIEAKEKYEAIARRGGSNPVKAGEVMELAKRFDGYQKALYRCWQDFVSLQLSFPSKPAE